MNKSPHFRKNEPIKNRLKQARSLFQPVLEFLYSGWSEGRPASSRSGSDIPKCFQLLQYPAELPLRDIAHIRKGLEQLLAALASTREDLQHGRLKAILHQIAVRVSKSGSMDQWRQFVRSDDRDILAPHILNTITEFSNISRPTITLQNGFCFLCKDKRKPQRVFKVFKQR